MLPSSQVTVSTPSLSPGQLLGRYRIRRRLGSGGMGEVFEAEHLALEKRCAIKVLRSDLAQDSEVRARFTREGVAASKLRHEHVVEVFDIDVVDEITFLVMEYLEGEDLASFLDRQGAMTVPAAADLLVPVIDAVSAAHAAGILHRDLKPSNIYLTRDGRGATVPKVLDFGIAKPMAGSEQPELTESGALIGTPRYMSPEQVRGERTLGPRSDQYSLGVILYECVTGKQPFSDVPFYLLLHSIATGKFQDPSRWKSDIPDGLSALVMRAMASNPAERFETLHVLALELLRYASPGAQSAWGRYLERVVDRSSSSRDGNVGDPDAEVEAADAERPVASAAALEATLVRRPRVRRDEGFEPEAAASAPPSDALSERSSSRSEPSLDAAEREARDGPVEARPRSRIPMLAAALAVSALLATALWWSTKETPTPQPVSEPEPEPEAELIPLVQRFRVVVDPTHATLRLDDDPAVTGELRGTFRPGATTHRIMVSAEGFVPRIITFRDGPPPSEIQLEPVAP